MSQGACLPRQMRITSHPARGVGLEGHVGEREMLSTKHLNKGGYREPPNLARGETRGGGVCLPARRSLLACHPTLPHHTHIHEVPRHNQAIHPILGKKIAIHTCTTLISPCAPQAPGLPKTRSGKIMRRVLRKIASKEEEQLGDTSTLADPNVVNVLVGLRGK